MSNEKPSSLVRFLQQTKLDNLVVNPVCLQLSNKSTPFHGIAVNHRETGVSRIFDPQGRRVDYKANFTPDTLPVSADQFSQLISPISDRFDVLRVPQHPELPPEQFILTRK